MKPKASLKSRKVNVRLMASRPRPRPIPRRGQRRLPRLRLQALRHAEYLLVGFDGGYSRWTARRDRSVSVRIGSEGIFLPYSCRDEPLEQH